MRYDGGVDGDRLSHVTPAKIMLLLVPTIGRAAVAAAENADVRESREWVRLRS
jgi:hypothetical protein